MLISFDLFHIFQRSRASSFCTVCICWIKFNLFSVREPPRSSPGDRKVEMFLGNHEGTAKEPNHFQFRFFFIVVTSNRNWYKRDFFGILCMVILDHFKDNFKNNYLIFKPNYFIYFLITAFFSYELYL
jgi:hypothetical protein